MVFQDPKESSAIPFGVWFLLLGAAFLSRFWNIDHLFLWPSGDEGLKGAAAIELSQKWDWRFFYTVGQNPPAFIWLCSFFFKFLKPALFDLWAPAALVSFLAFLLGWLTARKVFSNFFSLIFVFLLGFSYWPLYLGHRCLPAVSVPLGEMLLLFSLVHFLKSKGNRKSFWALVSGVCLGLLSFTYVSWPVVGLWGAGVFLYMVFLTRGPRRIWVFLFGVGAFTALLPFLLAVFREGYGQHISALTPWSGWFRDRNLFANSFLYLDSLFWNLSGFAPGDALSKGGFLNPFLCSFFLLGTVEMIRSREKAWVRWLAGAFLLFLIPGFVSLNVQTFRVVQLLPPLLLITTLGFKPLWDFTRGRQRWIILAGILLGSTLLDTGRLTLPYQEISTHPERFLGTGKSLARYRAFKVLTELKEKLGPGIVLGEWDIPADRTIEVATYFFNAACHPSLDPTLASWLAVVTDNHYTPFLEKRFPGVQWWDLDSDFSRDGNRALGIIQVNPSNRGTVLKWASADRAFRDMNWAIDHVYERDCLEVADRKIRENYPLIKGDPFLESCFWEKAAYFYYYIGGHFPEHLHATELAVSKGYPASHLYKKLAELRGLAGKKDLAQAALKKEGESERLFPWRR